MYKVFLCHASEDKPVAERIELALSAAGYRVFYDEQSLPPGADFHARIEQAILECDLFIFLISASSIAVGKFTLTELKFARKRWPSPIGRVLPVNLQNLPTKEIPAYLTAATLLTVAGNPASEVRAAAESMCAAAPRRKLRRIAVTIAVVSLVLTLSLTVWWFTHSPKEVPVVPAGAKAPIASASASFVTPSPSAQNIPPAVSGWQVVIGDYKNQMEALQKQESAAKLGYSNSEIYGEPPHLHMRFRFSSKQDATTAAEKLKAARVSHEPDVVPYRPK